MNEFVPVSAFPKFFDEESIHFLLKITEKDLELEKFKEKLNVLRQKIKDKRDRLSVTTTRDLYRTVKGRLRNISQSSIGQTMNGSFFEDNTENVLEETSQSFDEITETRKKIREIEEKMKEMTVFEILRVTQGYQNNPGEKEKVGLLHVIKCLVGDKASEFKKYTR